MLRGMHFVLNTNSDRISLNENVHVIPFSSDFYSVRINQVDIEFVYAMMFAS